MRKLFTIDDLFIALVAAVGYGFSFEIPKILDYPEWLCIVVCLVVGTTLEGLAYKIVFSKTIQEKTAYRLTAFAVLIIIFFVARYIAASMGVSMLNYVEEQFQFVIIPPILVFAFNMALRQYRIKKIRKRYGDGSGGFVFDDQLKQSDLDELNQQNRQIHGAFDADLAVKTKTGVFVGEKEKDTIFFSGIPYAKPPIGELRWKAPEPIPESEDVFEAKHFGASAIQVDYDGSFFKHHRQSEDCLTLNICIARKRREQKKPVLVFFHHGDFTYGGSADPLLHGDEFIKIYPDSVGVTFNYRLGIFGFIDFSEVPGGEEYPDALNLGLLDQIAALRWIKENISAFGGDPERITVMGFESGALSLSLLAACEQAKGLFQKAFIFYGDPMFTYSTPETSRHLAKKLLQKTSTTTMEELLRLSAQQLKEASQKLVLDLASGPTREGKMFPLDMYAAYQNGAASSIEFIIGIPSNERQIYKSLVGEKKYEDFISKELDEILHFLDDNYPAEAKAVRAYVEEQASMMPALEAKAKMYEQFYTLSTYRCAKKLLEGGNKVYLLYWNVKPLIENLGSGTVDVAAAFLGSRKAVQLYGNVQNRDIAETLQKLFQKFERGDEMRLFNNEIKGIGAVDWKEFPKALIVSEKAFKCEPIANKLTEVKGLLKILAE
ncbi:MAG: carboxylesterase family protein [Selenomonadaceae bacterium]|nr:carboxylesterase family protein [Selenomonadaceae bacterium]